MNTNKLNLKIKKILGNQSKRILMSLIFPVRNKFLLFNVTNTAKKNRVNLNYWLESDNLGDTLSPLIVNYLLSLQGISPDAKVDGCRHLYAVGSVLTAGIQDCTVWGSGILNASLTYRLKKRKFDIRSVRGPFTRVILADYGIDSPEVFGDPAIFLPEIYSPKSIGKKYKFGLVMHKDQILEYEKKIDIHVIDICTSNYKFFIDEIASSEIVISSSLHGIIIAESFGVKAVLLKPKVDLLKYYDWYYSTKRYEFPIANTIEEAMTIVPLALPKLDELRQKQRDAFPYDLYK